MSVGDAAKAGTRWIDAAEAHWRERGSALTSVRKLICGEIAGRTDPFDAEELLKACREMDGLISLTTIYRTLKSLVEAALLLEMEGVENKRLFRPRLHEEISDSTLVCSDCDAVIPIESPCLALRETEAARRMGFSAKRMSLRIHVSCDEFRETGKCSRRKKD